MENIAVIFGGESTEHDISIISALQAIENLDKVKYKIFPVYINKHGKWLYGDKLTRIETFKNFNEKKLKKVCIVPQSNWLYAKTALSYKKITKIDCALLILHGKNGEDGTMQGLLQLAKIPYTSCNTLGSAIGMDKLILKLMFNSMNLNVLPYFWFNKADYENKKDEIIHNTEFDFPKIVKPCNLGSSIGINVCEDEVSLEKAIDIAFQFDNKIIVEKALTNFKEINISCLRNGTSLILSDIEQPKNWKKFLDFEEKYLTTQSKSTNKTCNKNKKIKISKKHLSYIQKSALEIYNTLNLSGVVRFDYMIDKQSNNVYINEINTIPGSLSYYLWQKLNINFTRLLDILINEAKETMAKENSLKTIYISDVLNKNFDEIKKLN